MRAIQKGELRNGLWQHKHREEYKVLQEQKGDLSGGSGKAVYVSNIHISYLEAGTKAPSLELLILIANALDVSADDLLVDNLTHTSSAVGQELHVLLQNCNHDEKEMLIRILVFMKELFQEFNIWQLNAKNLPA